jgi:hypothetical protein
VIEDDGGEGEQAREDLAHAASYSVPPDT